MNQKFVTSLILLLFFVVSCIGYYKIPENEQGERIVHGNADYTFTQIPSDADLIKIDTTALYVQIFEGRNYNDSEKENPEILIFHNDGFFRRTSMFNHSVKIRNKNDIFYGGKYRLKDDQIELEVFYPTSGGNTNYYKKVIRHGYMVEDRIIFDDNFTQLTMYKKMYELE